MTHPVLGQGARLMIWELYGSLRRKRTITTSSFLTIIGLVLSARGISTTLTYASKNDNGCGFAVLYQVTDSSWLGSVAQESVEFAVGGIWGLEIHDATGIYGCWIPRCWVYWIRQAEYVCT